MTDKKIEEAAREFCEAMAHRQISEQLTDELASWARTLIAEAVAEKDREIGRLRKGLPSYVLNNLADAAEAVEKAEAALKQARELAGVLLHHPNCKLINGWVRTPGPCDCGLDDLRAFLAAHKESL